MKVIKMPDDDLAETDFLTGAFAETKSSAYLIIGCSEGKVCAFNTKDHNLKY